MNNGRASTPIQQSGRENTDHPQMSEGGFPIDLESTSLEPQGLTSSPAKPPPLPVASVTSNPVFSGPTTSSGGAASRSRCLTGCCSAIPVVCLPSRRRKSFWRLRHMFSIRRELHSDMRALFSASLARYFGRQYHRRQREGMQKCARESLHSSLAWGD